MLSLLEQKGNLHSLLDGWANTKLFLTIPSHSKTVSKLNPASVIPEPDSAVLICAWADIFDEVYSSRIDLQDHPLEEADWTLYAHVSSYMVKGNRKAGYAAIIPEGIVEVKALLPGTSDQKAELIALTRALELSHEESKYVY